MLDRPPSIVEEISAGFAEARRAALAQLPRFRLEALAVEKHIVAAVDQVVAWCAELAPAIDCLVHGIARAARL
jgi:hypothetical protein